MLGMDVYAAIGDFALKLPSAYMRYLFRFMPYEGHADLTTMHKRIQTPPYVIATPSVRFTDLRPFQNNGPLLMLFSDGVDHLVDGYFVFSAGTSRNGDACDVVSRLLQDHADPAVEDLLGHKTQPRWSGDEGNRAVDVLGNLMGGLDSDRLQKMTDQTRFADKTTSPVFFVDDVTIVICAFC